MGSSPVTATTPIAPLSARARLREHLVSTLARLGASPADRCVVAFSGGGDSAALLLAIRDAAWPALAVHVDHRLDPGSAERATAAARLARRLGVDTRCERIPDSAWKPGESLEAGARRVRYATLESVADQEGARWILTAHHLEDQAETVVLRMLFGSGLVGLAAIHERRGRLLRPLLDLPRRALQSALAEVGLEGICDPTNTDLRRPRNRIRRHMLPQLRAADPGVDRRLADLARAALAARPHLPRPKTEKNLAPFANPAPPFSYTFAVPGSISLQSLGLRLSVEPTIWQPWMAQGAALATGLALPPTTSQVTVRSRRPGDRLRPLGAPGERKLKDVLIDRKMPRGDRDRLPLLEVDGTLAWVPGVTIADQFRCVPGAPVWIARLEGNDEPAGVVRSI